MHKEYSRKEHIFQCLTLERVVHFFLRLLQGIEMNSHSITRRLILSFIVGWAVGVAHSGYSIGCNNDFAKIGYVPKEGVGEPESWDYDGPARAKREYEEAFAHVIYQAEGQNSSGYFEKFLRSRRINNLRIRFLKFFGRKTHSPLTSNHVLDLFGSGFFIRRNNADSVTGLRFGPFSKELETSQEKSCPLLEEIPFAPCPRQS